jgi:hypothetical protein
MPQWKKMFPCTFYRYTVYVRKNAQVVADPQTSCNKVVVREEADIRMCSHCLLKCCDKRNKLLSAPCYKVDDGKRLATIKLFQQD